MPPEKKMWHASSGVIPGATHSSYKPTLTVQDTGGPDQPTDTITIQFAFTLKADINVYTTTACSLTSPSDPGTGGSGGVSVFYSVTGTSNEKEISNESSSDFRTRITQKCATSGSTFTGKIITQGDFMLKKVGAPAATPVISCKIWNSSGTVLYTSATTLAPNTLTTSFASYTFSLSTNTHQMAVGDRIGLEWTGTDPDDYIVTGYETPAGSGSYEAYYEGTSWDEQTNRKISAVFWS